MHCTLSLAGALSALPGILAGAAPQDAAKPAQAPPPWFREVAVESGIDWTHQSGASSDFWFPEIMGGGAALFDYDGDGDLDLYLVQSGSLREVEGPKPGNKLFRNDGRNAAGALAFADVTDEAGVGDTGYGMGAACGDFDRDGDVDLYVTNVGANVLYQNGGKGKFQDVTQKLKAGDTRWSTSAGFFDADGNGTLDLYVVNNLGWFPENETPCFNYYGERDYCSPTNYNAPSTDSFFTFGRLGFTDSTIRAGINLAFGNGLGVTFGDYDLDGDLDVYVANDATPNQLWSNDGKGVFTDVAPGTGCAVNMNGTPEAGMGVQFVDVDQDEDLDLFMTHLRREKNTYYENRGKRFYDVSNRTGMAAISARFTGFGMGYHDFDLDGVLDLYVANGAVQAWKESERFAADPYAEPNHLFKGARQEKGLRFTLVSPEGGTAEPIVATSRGAAFGDIDSDGDVDVVVVDRDARVKLLENVAPRAGGWVGFEVLDAKEKPCAVHGATVSIQGEGEARQYRQADPCYSYLSSNDPRVHFGIGARTTVTGVRVRWPDGTTESFPDVAPGAYHRLKKGTGVDVE